MDGWDGPKKEKPKKPKHKHSLQRETIPGIPINKTIQRKNEKTCVRERALYTFTFKIIDAFLIRLIKTETILQSSHYLRYI